MAELLTVDQALEMFNAVAEKHGGKPRKQFRNRATAEAAFASIGLAAPDWGDGKAAAKPAKPASKAEAPKVSAAKDGKSPRPAKANGAAKDGRNVVEKDEDPLLAAFQALRGSNHAKVLKRLEAANGKPVALAELQKATGTEKSAVLMTVGGLIKKTEGKSLRGKPRPKYKIVKSRTDDDKKELQIALQAE